MILYSSYFVYFRSLPLKKKCSKTVSKYVYVSRKEKVIIEGQKYQSSLKQLIFEKNLSLLIEIGSKHWINFDVSFDIQTTTWFISIELNQYYRTATHFGSAIWKRFTHFEKKKLIKMRNFSKCVETTNAFMILLNTWNNDIRAGKL